MESLRSLFAESLRALDPAVLVAERVRDRSLPLPVTVLALGEICSTNGDWCSPSFGDRDRLRVRRGSCHPAWEPRGMESTHPTISEASIRAGEVLMAAAGRAKGSTLVLVSGGGSALACCPAQGLTRTEMSECVAAVYRAGADIHELNSVRKHLSRFKGGGLASAGRHCPMLTLAISDVAGDRISSIASGPTAVDPTTFADALSVVLHHLGDDASGPAVEHLRAGAKGLLPETLREAPPAHACELLAGMSMFARTAARLAKKNSEFDDVHLLEELLEGLVDELAQLISTWTQKSGLWVAGGEGTIRLCDNPGQGGRAQHLALQVAMAIDGRDDVELLVAGTDGVDGNSPSAGAVVDGASVSRARILGLDPQACLRHCDSHRLLKAIGATIDVGPTGINYADIVLCRVRAVS